MTGMDPRENEGGVFTSSPQYRAVWWLGKRHGFEQGLTGGPETAVPDSVLEEAERISKLSDLEARLL